MDLARPSCCCLDTALNLTAERVDNLIDMLSDRDIITVGDERFRCVSIFQAK